MPSVGSFFSYVDDARSHEPEVYKEYMSLGTIMKPLALLLILLLLLLLLLFYKNVFPFKMLDYKSKTWVYNNISLLFIHNQNYCTTCVWTERKILIYLQLYLHLLYIQYELKNLSINIINVTLIPFITIFQTTHFYKYIKFLVIT